VRAAGRQEFIERAILVQNEEMAFLMRRWAEMIAAYHAKVRPVARLVRLGKAPFVQRADGVLVGLFPLDHLAWTGEISRRHATNMKSIRGIPGITGGEVWLEGTISVGARKALEKQNWIVRENTGGDLGLN
jgi:hypothetical protein